MISWSWLVYCAEWCIRLVMLFVVVRKRRPSSALAWLTIIFFQPEIGLLLYLLIGRHRLSWRRTRRHARLLKHLKNLEEQFNDHPHLVQPQLGETARAAIILAENYGSMPILKSNDVEFITNSRQGINRLIDDINQAKDHIHILVFIFGADETGQRVAEALKQAVKRGVKCRLLVDAVGSRPMLRQMTEDLRTCGVEVFDALPVGLLRRQAARIDMRNHRKIVVIDGRIGYTGSQNIINADYGHKDLIWRDLMVRLQGPIVQELQTVFLVDWNFRTGQMPAGDNFFPVPHHIGEVPVQALPSGPNYPTENYQRLVVTAVHSAQRRIIITTPYFVPDEPFLQALQVAAQRQVRTELIIPRKTDHPLVDLAGSAYFDDLLAAGVRIYIYQAGLLHAKTMSIDDSIAFVGSSNFDIRSFSLDFEINMLLYGNEIVERLRRCQLEYFKESILLQAEVWKERSVSLRAAQNMAVLLSPLL